MKGKIASFFEFLREDVSYQCDTNRCVFQVCVFSRPNLCRLTSTVDDKQNARKLIPHTHSFYAGMLNKFESNDTHRLGHHLCYRAQRSIGGRKLISKIWKFWPKLTLMYLTKHTRYLFFV